MKELLRELSNWLTANRPNEAPYLNPGATDKQIAALAAALGEPVPAELAALLRWHDGQPARAEFFHPEFQLLTIAEIIEDLEMHRDYVASGDYPPDWWPDRWIPFTANGSGDSLCIDLDRGGAIYNFWHDDAGRPKRADSLAAFMQEILDDFRSRDWVYHNDSFMPVAEAQAVGLAESVEVVLLRMPDSGLRSLKVIKEKLSLDLGIGAMLSMAKSAPCQLCETSYFLARREVNAIRRAIGEDCLQVYRSGDRQSPLPLDD